MSWQPGHSGTGSRTGKGWGLYQVNHKDETATTRGRGVESPRAGFNYAQDFKIKTKKNDCINSLFSLDWKSDHRVDVDTMRHPWVTPKQAPPSSCSIHAFISRVWQCLFVCLFPGCSFQSLRRSLIVDQTATSDVIYRHILSPPQSFRSSLIWLNGNFTLSSASFRTRLSSQHWKSAGTIMPVL